jgi:biotin carboxyl carrier protein
VKFQLEIADRLRTVEVVRERHGYKVTIDGQPRQVEAVRVGPDAWSLLVRDESAATSRSVEAVVLSQPGNGTLDVHIDGYSIPVHLRNGLGRRTRDLGGGGAVGPAGPLRVLAPMPGKVVRLLVKPGDEVKNRQGLVVVEAMKMENELRAARAGRIREVLVREGQSVDAGTALVVVE